MTLEGKQLHHYLLLRPIGKGGMGEVYLAEDHSVQRQVAIKVLPLEVEVLDQQATDERLRLFQREASAIARLDHAHILPLYTYGQERIDNQLLAYLVMPYRAEGSLLTWLRRRAEQSPTKQLTLAQVAHLIGQAASALQYAHERQIIHRDIKPANFLVRSQTTIDAFPDLQLADFGIARLEQATTTTSQIMGTPVYMAPEQWAGQAGPASDQYALAIMTYELLTGTVPFRGSSVQIMYAHLHESPQPPSMRNARLSSALDAVLLQALAKSPAERFFSVEHFAQALQAACRAPEDATSWHVPPSPSDPSSLQKPQSSGISAPSSLTDLQVSPAIPPSSMHSMQPSSPNLLTPKTAHIFGQKVSRRQLGMMTLGGLGGALLALAIGETVARQVSSLQTLFSSNPPKTPEQTPHLPQSSMRWTARQGHGVGVAWSKSQSLWVAVDTFDIFTSSDGINWANQSLFGDPNIPQLRAVACSDSLWVAVGTGVNSKSEMAGAILTSPDGHTWTSRIYGSFGTMLNAVAYANSLWVIVGNNGLILTSPDGHTWTPQTSGTRFALTGVARLDGLWIANSGGFILTSPDGHTWTPQTTTTEAVTGIAWSGSLWVAVGTGGILTSADGRTWTPQSANIDPGTNLWGVAWAASLWVAVGSGPNGQGSLLLTSSDGHSWTPQTISSTSEPLYSVARSDSLWVVVGEDTILTSP